MSSIVQPINQQENNRKISNQSMTLRRDDEENLGVKRIVELILLLLFIYPPVTEVAEMAVR